MSIAQVTTYQPTDAEIITVTASAKRRHPEMAARLDKAAALLLSGSVQLDPVAWERGQLARWRIASQSGRGAYVVNGLACPCQDSRAPHVGRARCCKHSMAVALYSKILTNKLNADIRSFNVELGILPDGTFQAYAHNKRMGMVQIRKMGPKGSPGVYTFANDASLAHYAIWLAAQPVARPVGTRWPTVAAVAA